MSGGECHKKYNERGIEFEIKTLEDRAAALEKRGEDASFERLLIKEYKKYRPGDYCNKSDGQA
jgi:hypothetical protein